MSDRLTNGMSGEVNIELDKTPANGCTYYLTAAFVGDQQGTDGEPQVMLYCGRDSKVDGPNEIHMFCISTKRLRRICELAELMHKVGDDQFNSRDGGGSDD